MECFSCVQLLAQTGSYISTLGKRLKQRYLSILRCSRRRVHRHRFRSPPVPRYQPCRRRRKQGHLYKCSPCNIFQTCLSSPSWQSYHFLILEYRGNRQNYQHYTAYGGGTSYYTIPQYQYSTPQSAAFVSVPAQANVATKPQAQPSQSSTPQPQTQQQTTEQQTSTDISTLNDALGSAGLDLRVLYEFLTMQN